MANYVERLKIILDLEGENTNKSLTKIRNNVRDADSTFGKFKAAGSGALQSISANAGALAVAGGAALIAFGVKAVHAFETTARAALDLSKATGLSIEQASRWVAVGDDFTVSAEALQTGLGKVAKTLDASKWGDYGIATRDASGEARAVNDILLDSLDMLSKVDNATERARIGQELFGKGYQSLTPLLGHTRAEYEKMLGAVEDGQTITSAEAARAEKMRLAEDNLGDALADVTLAFGQMFAAGAPVLNLLASLTGQAAELVGIVTGGDAKSMSEPILAFRKAVAGSDGDVVKVINAFAKLKHAAGDSRSTMDKATRGVGDFFEALAGGNVTAEENLANVKKAFASLAEESPADAKMVATALTELVFAAKSGNEKAIEFADNWGLSLDVLIDLAATVPGVTWEMSDLGESTGEFADKAADAAYEAAQMRDRVTEAKNRLKDLHDEIDGRKSLVDLKVQLRDNAQKMADLAAEYEDGKISAEDYYLAVQSASLDSQGAVVDYAEAVGNIPDTAVTNILATFDPSKPGGIDSTLDTWAANKSLNVTVNGQIADSALRNMLEGRGLTVPVTFTGPAVGRMKNASGTSSSPGGLTLINEQGSSQGGEIINMPKGASVMSRGQSLQARQRGGVGGTTIGTLIVQTNDPPRRWLDELPWRIA